MWIVHATFPLNKRGPKMQPPVSWIYVNTNEELSIGTKKSLSFKRDSNQASIVPERLMLLITNSIKCCPKVQLYCCTVVLVGDASGGFSVVAAGCKDMQFF